MMKVALIVRGGLRIGMGHVSRCLTLAEEMKNKAEIVFFSNDDEGVGDYIQDRGFEIYHYNSYADLLNKLKRINPERLVVDINGVSENLARILKEHLPARLAFWGNMKATNRYADIVVNDVAGQYINSQFQNLRCHDLCTHKQIFSGPRYLLIRNEFFKWKKRNKIISPQIVKILLSFGGSDPSNLTTQALEAIWNSGRNYQIRILLGAKFPWKTELEYLVNQYSGMKKQLEIDSDVSNVGELMYSSDLVICSLGTSLFEALYVGTPVIGISQNSKQTHWFKGFLPALNRNQMDILIEVIEKKGYIRPDNELIRNMEIGEGKAELVKAVLGE